MGILLFPTLAVLCPEQPASRHGDAAAGASPAAYNFSFLSEILLMSGSAGPALSARLVPTPSGNCPVNAFPLAIQQCQRCPHRTPGAAAIPAAVRAHAKYPKLFFLYLNSHRLSLHNTFTQIESTQHCHTGMFSTHWFVCTSSYMPGHTHWTIASPSNYTYSTHLQLLY